MFNGFLVESARIQYERDLAVARDLSQFAPARPRLSERIATRRATRRGGRSDPPTH